MTNLESFGWTMLNLPLGVETQGVPSLSQEITSEGNGYLSQYYGIIPWREEPGGLQSRGPQTVSDHV